MGELQLGKYEFFPYDDKIQRLLDELLLTDEEREERRREDDERDDVPLLLVGVSNERIGTSFVGSSLCATVVYFD